MSKPTNFQVARYAAEQYGNKNLSDEMLTVLAKKMKLNAKLLIKNYRFVIAVNNIPELSQL